jgi:photosystem II stability/assembly factor-like uncharacterized protein
MDRFRSPRETNAFRRLPAVRGELVSITTANFGQSVWAVGTRGLILTSADNGATWTKGEMVRPPDDAPGRDSAGGAAPQGPPRLLNHLRTVHFTDAQNGWAGGDGIIVRTTDGGRRWASVPGGKVGVLNLESRTGDDGFAATDSGLIETTNGGRSWQQGVLKQALRDVGSSRAVAAVLDRDGQVLVQMGTTWRNVTQELGASTHRPTALAVVDSSIFVAMLQPSAGPGRAVEILYSPNGGTNWVRSSWLANFDPDWGVVRRIITPARNVVFAVTERGELVRADDAGGGWSVRRTGVQDVAFADVDHGYAVTNRNTIIKTLDGGQSWRTVAGAPSFRAVHFLDEERGIAVGDAGIAATTRDGGQTWTTQTVGRLATLNAITTFNERTALIAGDDGVIRYRAANGTWEELFVLPSRNPVTALTSAPAFGGTEEVFAVTDRGDVYAQPIGKAWQLVGRVDDHHIKSIRILSSGTCFALGANGVWSSSDRCRTWTLRRAGSYHAVEFRDDASWWIAGGGWMFRTVDGGVGWDSVSLGASDTVNAVRMVNPRVGWAVGRNARVWSTADSGTTWQLRPVNGVDTIGAKPDLLALAVFGDTLARAVGEGGTVIEGTREGEWRIVVRPAGQMPAPWYWVAVCLCVAVIVLARPQTPPEEIIGPKDIFTSDRALRTGDHDLLGFEDMAQGLSRFLRNPGTEPPLTLAITGVWGHGKTSLMNLVREDLQHRKQRVVWFNAWDHENEQSLLASLLSAVQAQVVPGISQPFPALRFRLKLIRERLFGNSSRAKTTASLAVFSLFLIFGFALGMPTTSREAWQTVTGILTAFTTPGGLENWWRNLASGSQGAGLWQIGLVIASGVTFIVALSKTLTAFGVKPGALLAPVTQAARLRDLNDSTGFRHRFAQDFQYVTAALRPARLVIFIDDLDRCRPEGIRTVLEAINFLSQAGDCLIVLGMDEKVVRRDVYRYFLQVAKEARELDADCGDPRTAAAEAWAQADGFFEKLINIEVHLPSPEGNPVEHIISDPDGPDDAAGSAAKARKRQTVRGLTTVAVLGATALIMTWAVASLPPRAGAGDGARSDPFVAQAAVGRGGAPPSAPGPVQNPSTGSEYRLVNPARVPASIPERPSALLPPEKSRRIGLWLLAPILAAMALAAYHILYRPQPNVKDSPQFRRALELWAPLLTRELRTPRAGKRFLNRLRYYAMMAGGDQQDPRRNRLWEAIKTTFRMDASNSAPRVATQRETIPDQVLVALAAIEVLDPEALQPQASEELVHDFRSYVRRRFGQDDTKGVRSIDYTSKMDDHIRRFRELSGTVTTH